jgi:hypothetical protein
MEGLGKDRLEGAAALAAFIGEPIPRTFRLLEAGKIPAGKQGGKWIGSKKVVREHYARLTRGNGA